MMLALFISAWVSTWLVSGDPWVSGVDVSGIYSAFPSAISACTALFTAFEFDAFSTSTNSVVSLPPSGAGILFPGSGSSSFFAGSVVGSSVLRLRFGAFLMWSNATPPGMSVAFRALPA